MSPVNLGWGWGQESCRRDLWFQNLQHGLLSHK